MAGNATISVFKAISVKGAITQQAAVVDDSASRPVGEVKIRETLTQAVESRPGSVEPRWGQSQQNQHYRIVTNSSAELG
jgi:hypothetical protein